MSSGNTRGGAEALTFDENPSSLITAFQGDTDIPVIFATLTSPPSNEQTAYVSGIGVQFNGVSGADLSGVHLYRDFEPIGQLGHEDLSHPQLAQGTVGPTGFSSMSAFPTLTVAPGERVYLVITVDISWTATVDAEFSANVGTAQGVYSTGVVSTLYSFPADPHLMKIFEYMPTEYRAAANLRLNELIFTDNVVEIKDTSSDTGVSLTNPQISVRFFGQDEDLTLTSDNKKDFSGSTNSSGFAVLQLSPDFSLTTSTDTITYTVRLYCATCGTGGTNKSIDAITVPTGTARGAYGRYQSDGTGGWRDTDNNTSGLPNTIPEFQDAAVPLVGVVLLIGATGWRRRAKGDAPDALFP